MISSFEGVDVGFGHRFKPSKGVSNFPLVISYFEVWVHLIVLPNSQIFFQGVFDTTNIAVGQWIEGYKSFRRAAHATLFT